MQRHDVDPGFSVGHRIGFLETPPDLRHFRLGSIQGHAGHQAPDYPQEVEASGVHVRFQRQPRPDLDLGVDGVAEVTREYSHDRASPSVELKSAAHDVVVAAEQPLPQPVADDDGIRAGRIGVILDEQPTAYWVHVKHGEHVG